MHGLWGKRSATTRDFGGKTFSALLEVWFDGHHAKAALDVWRLDLAKTIKILPDVDLVET